MEKVKGIYTCNVCGRDFPLLFEEQYIARDSMPAEFAALTADNQYDAFDCPHCGCQNVIQPRKPEYCPCDYGICDECCREDEEEEKDDAPQTPCQKCGKE